VYLPGGTWDTLTGSRSVVVLLTPCRGVVGGGQSGLDAKPRQDEAVQDEPAGEKQGQGEQVVWTPWRFPCGPGRGRCSA